MTATNAATRSRISDYANAVKRHGRESTEASEARRLLAEQQIADAIERVVAKAPPLSVDQQQRLAQLLRPAPQSEARSA
jgi:hypothetical protein